MFRLNNCDLYQVYTAKTGKYRCNVVATTTLIGFSREIPADGHWVVLIADGLEFLMSGMVIVADIVRNTIRAK